MKKELILEKLDEIIEASETTNIECAGILAGIAIIIEANKELELAALISPMVENIGIEYGFLERKNK